MENFDLSKLMEEKEAAREIIAMFSNPRFQEVFATLEEQHISAIKNCKDKEQRSILCDDLVSIDKIINAFQDIVDDGTMANDTTTKF